MDKFYAVLTVHCVLVYFLLQLVHYSLLFFAAHFVERIAVFATCLVITTITFGFTKRWCLQDEIDVSNKAVLITGCDSGFGHLLAQRLDSKGFKVFASCLFPSGPGASELKTVLSEQSKVFGLDVRKQDSVENALKFVKQNLGSYEFWAVVNNAGIRKGFTTELSRLRDFEDCLDVNALGHVRVTKAFLSLLRPFKGRIINVNSFSSRYALPDASPYCMSKFASVAFNDCLRAELASTGIKVISIEPTAFQSPIADPDVVIKDMEEKIAENEEEIMKNYGQDYIEKCRKFCYFYARTVSKDVQIVINYMEHAVCCRYPDSIYVISTNIFVLSCHKLYVLLPPFIQDCLYRLTPRIFCKITHKTYASHIRNLTHKSNRK